MPLRKTALLFMFALALRSFGSSPALPHQVMQTSEFLLISEEELITLIGNAEKNRPSPLFQLIRKKQSKSRKITAALLAFPFPLGIVGMHRIYLGTAPYVPVVYIASVGGVFGILPFIDFCMILLEKDVERFSNNTRVFMWVD